MLKYSSRFVWLVIAGVLIVGAGRASAQAPTPTELAQIAQGREDFARSSFRAGSINPRTPRAIGMADAFVAVGGSYDSMFYNPSGIASIPEWQFSIIGVRGESNKDTYKFVKDGKDIQGSDQTKINSFFQSRIGEVYYANVNNISHVVIPCQKKWVFGLAYAYTYQIDGRVSQQTPVLPASTGNYITAVRKLEDNAGYATAAYRVYQDIFDIGLTLKFVDRIDIRNSETPDSVAVNGDVSYNKDFFKPFKGGSDFSAGSDIGFIGRLPFRLLMGGGGEEAADEAPSPWGFKNGYVATGFTFQDVARTRFKAKTPDPAHGILVSGGSDVPMTVDWGLATSVPFEVGKVTLAFDIRDINRDEIKLSQKYSLGLEFALRYLLTLRGGINANGFAAGAEFRMAAARLNAEFVQERNTALVDNKKETRIAGGLSFGWPYK